MATKIYYFPEPRFSGPWLTFDELAAPTWFEFNECKAGSVARNRFIVDASEPILASVLSKDVLPCHSIKAVGPRMLELIDKIASQYVCQSRVFIRTSGGEIESQFMALGFSANAAIIDLQGSDYDWVPNNNDPSRQIITRFKRIVFNAIPQDLPPIFLETSDRARVLCSEAFVNECKRLKLKLHYTEFGASSIQ